METTMLKEIPLIKERTTIGRKPHNDIQIDNLAISGEHAVVITILNDSFLEDLGSTNGTFVNGQSVKKHFLKNGDTIELGKYRLKYVSELPQQTSNADFEKTMILRPGAAHKPAPDPSAPAAPAAAAEPVEEQTEFDVVIKDAGPKKIEVIKTIRQLTNLGLKEAKDVAETAGSKILEAVSKDAANDAKAKLEAVGAVIEVK